MLYQEILYCQLNAQAKQAFVQIDINLGAKLLNAINDNKMEELKYLVFLKIKLEFNNSIWYYNLTIVPLFIPEAEYFL